MNAGRSYDNRNDSVYKVESFNNEFNRNDSDDFGEGEAEDTQFVKTGGLSAQMKLQVH